MLKEPRIKMQDLFGVLFIFIGYLLYLAAMHLLTINSAGNTASVLNTIFIVSLNIFYALLIFAGVGLIILLLRWLAWITQTPLWMRKGGKK